MSLFDRDCEWYCDDCDAHLNNQWGFTTITGIWTCTECGYENDVSESNILHGEEADFVGSLYIVCPYCHAHMRTDDGDHFECPDCDCSGVFDFDLDELIEDQNTTN